MAVTLFNAAGQSVRMLFNGTVPANEMQRVTVDSRTLPSGSNEDNRRLTEYLIIGTFMSFAYAVVVSLVVRSV